MAILSEIKQIQRKDGFFIIDGAKIPSVRKASSGYGVVLIFEKSQLDKDFEEIIGPNRFAWFPSAESLSLISKELDLSDHLTRDLRKGEGWNSGPRPFEGSQNIKIADLL